MLSRLSSLILCGLSACVSSSDAALSASASNISTGNPQKCSNGTKYFPQPIDHTSFNGNYDDNSTFLHQYEVIDQYYKPGGPILFYQSVESPIVCLEYTQLPEWAKELGALVVALEHRYFGLSCPYGLHYAEKANWNPKLLKPLTLDNVHQDAMSLLSWIKTTAYPAAKDAKIIVLGGSYGGSLAASMRTNYPDFFHGAIGSAPVTNGLVTDPLDKGAFGWGVVMDMVYGDYSTEASKKIQASMVELRSRMASGRFDGLQEQLHLCTPPNDTSQVDTLIKSIVGIYGTNLQKNFPENGYPFYNAMNATLAANDSMDVIGAAIAINNAWNKLPCLTWQTNLTAVDPFNYIRCTYLPYPNIYTPSESIWGPSLPDYTAKHVNDYMCQPAFGIDSIDGGLEYQRKIGLDQATLESTPRLLIAKQTMDPTSALGPDSWNPGHTRNTSQILLINQAGHGEDLSPSGVEDASCLVQARLFEFNAMKNWLGLV